MERAFFSSVMDALTFAFNHEDSTIPSPVMNREMAEAKWEEVKGAPVPPITVRPSLIPKHVALGNLNDRTILAGWILAKIRPLNMVHQHLLAAQFTKARLPCECGSACCQGWFFSKAWGTSVRYLVDHLKYNAEVSKKPGKRGYSTDPKLRILLVEDFTRAPERRLSLARLADIAGVSAVTVASHKNLIFEYLDKEAGIALEEVTAVFERTGVTGNLES